MEIIIVKYSEISMNRLYLATIPQVNVINEANNKDTIL